MMFRFPLHQGTARYRAGVHDMALCKRWSGQQRLQTNSDKVFDYERTLIIGYMSFISIALIVAIIEAPGHKFGSGALTEVGWGFVE